jgi:predicted amino acid racemase
MPYQGGKIRIQKTIKILSVSVVIFMFVVGIYLQMQLLQKNRYRSQLQKKFEKEYSAVMFGKAPAPKSDPMKKLESELRHIKDAKSGQLSITGQQSASAKLTLLFEAFNKCAAQTKLNVDSITVAAKTINITGDTSSRENTLKVFETIRANRLDILQQRLDAKGGRDSFSISVVPKQQ